MKIMHEQFHYKKSYDLLYFLLFFFSKKYYRILWKFNANFKNTNKITMDYLTKVFKLIIF